MRRFIFISVLTALGCVSSSPQPSQDETPVGSAAKHPSMEEPSVEPTAQPAGASKAELLPPTAPGGRRVFRAHKTGERLGISYGPFREGHHPDGPYPSADQIAEDLRMLDPDFDMIRVYSSLGPTETILQTIRDEKLGLGVVVGAWVGPEDDAKNTRDVANAVRLANAFPDQVWAVSVGNESQVDWSAHVVPAELLIGHIRTARAGVKQPVTTADDYNFWNKPRSKAVADEVDFIMLHAYAMWNGKSLDEAMPWTGETLASIQEAHPGVPIAFGETGWATVLNPEGNERNHITAPAGEAEQARFFSEVYGAPGLRDIPVFTFEAFDEPWKGSDNPLEIEKHWGIYNVDRTPKPAVKALRDALASEVTP